MRHRTRRGPVLAPKRERQPRCPRRFPELHGRQGRRSPCKIGGVRLENQRNHIAIVVFRDRSGEHLIRVQHGYRPRLHLLARKTRTPTKPLDFNTSPVFALAAWNRRFAAAERARHAEACPPSKRLIFASIQPQRQEHRRHRLRSCVSAPGFVLGWRKNGAPDRIRTCDLCLRRIKVKCFRESANPRHHTIFTYESEA